MTRKTKFDNYDADVTLNPCIVTETPNVEYGDHSMTILWDESERKLTEKNDSYFVRNRTISYNCRGDITSSQRRCVVEQISVENNGCNTFDDCYDKNRNMTISCEGRRERALAPNKCSTVLLGQSVLGNFENAMKKINSITTKEISMLPNAVYLPAKISSIFGEGKPNCIGKRNCCRRRDKGAFKLYCRLFDLQCIPEKTLLPKYSNCMIKD